MPFNFSIPTELEKQLQKVSNIDEIAPKMLSAAMPIVIKSIKACTPVNSGSLRDSIKASNPKLSKRGSWMCNIYFDGSEKRILKSGKTLKIPNAVKAAALEFGRRGRTKRDGSTGKRVEPRAFILKAVKDSSDEAAKAMQEIYEAEAKIT